jgi:hypothetical protein
MAYGLIHSGDLGPPIGGERETLLLSTSRTTFRAKGPLIYLAQPSGQSFNHKSKTPSSRQSGDLIGGTSGFCARVMLPALKGPTRQVVDQIVPLGAWGGSGLTVRHMYMADRSYIAGGVSVHPGGCHSANRHRQVPGWEPPMGVTMFWGRNANESDGYRAPPVIGWSSGIRRTPGHLTVPVRRVSWRLEELV